MAGIKDILDVVRSFSPESGTSPGFDDNVGLLIGGESSETPCAVTCLDVTESIVNEAAALGAKLILTHHPVIFNPLNRITTDTHTGRLILSAAKNGITIYSAHTNLDFCAGGINDFNAALIGLKNVTAMDIAGGIAIGKAGDLDKPVSLKSLTKILSVRFDDRYARYIGDGGALIRRAAVLNGSGGRIEYLMQAKAQCADCYISSEFPHHVLLFAKENKINLIHMQHYCMEHIYIKKWTEVLNSLAENAGLNVKFMQAKSESNPTQTEDL